MENRSAYYSQMTDNSEVVRRISSSKRPFRQCLISLTKMPTSHGLYPTCLFWPVTGTLPSRCPNLDIGCRKQPYPTTRPAVGDLQYGLSY
jgi:hypothetical protein